eukprot:TRINITY_DN2007_c0_g1_i5.p1 TRINITY_DN2007_c0_g1~~TRINITY_DN2007_c0_g1_i5.p1  ORF type:complete len:181 (+),score=26.94 TRINITY_DN2007_c0_g1_i5:303-845(+)
MCNFCAHIDTMVFLSSLAQSGHTGYKMNCFKQSEISRSGQLLKLGAVNKAWKERWFVLVGSKLYYFRNRDMKQPQGTVSVDQAYIRPSSDQQYCFEVVTSQRVFQLVAQSHNDMLKWIQALTEASSVSRENELFHKLEERICSVEAARCSTIRGSPPASSSQSPSLNSNDLLTYVSSEDD